MRMTLDTKTFQAAMDMVSRFVKPATLPILTHVYVDAREDGTVQLRVWNFSGGIETSVQAQVETPGQFTIPAKHVGTLLKYLSGSIEVTAGAGFTTVWKCGKSRHTLQGCDPKDYPCLPTLPDNTHSLSVNSPDLLTLLKGAAYAAGIDKSRPILCSVLLIIAPGSMYAVATDTHRLVKIGRQDASIDAPDWQAILSSETLNDFLTTLPDTGSVCLQADSKFVRAALADAGNTVIILRIVDGQYPNYSRIIPTEFAGNYIVNVPQTLAAVKRASLSTDDVKRLKIEVDGERMTIYAFNYGQLGAEEEVEVAAQEGSPASYAFGLNYDFLADALTHIGTERARFRCQENVLKPVVIEPIPDDGVPDRIALICSMNLNV